MEKINRTDDFNFRVIRDEDICSIMDEFPFDEVVWHESSLKTDMVYSNPNYARILLATAHSTISYKYLSDFKDVDYTYARAWQGKTVDGTNRGYHSDKIWETREPNLDRPVSNHIALYYHCDLRKSKAGGLKFWNMNTGNKEIYMPEKGDIVLINECDDYDHVYHKVINHDPTLKRLVVGFGFSVN